MIINYLKDRDLYLELVPVAEFKASTTVTKIGELQSPSMPEFMTMIRQLTYYQNERTPKFGKTWIPNHHQVSFDREVILDYGSVFVPNMYDDSDCYHSFLSILSTINNHQDGFVFQSRQPTELERAYGLRIFNQLLGTSGRANQDRESIL